MSRKYSFKILALLFLGSGLSTQALAQNLPGSAEPGRLNERFLQREQQSIPEIIPPEDLNIDETIPDALDGFVLKDISLKGVTAFQSGYFQDLLNEYRGRKVDINGLNHLAMRITQKYRQEGYLLSQAIIPQQDVTNGVVTIQIIEGHINDVIIDDSDGLIHNDHLNIFQNTVRTIKTLKLFHGPTLERYLLLLNESSGITVQSVLGAPEGTAKAGGADIILKVSKNKPSYALNYDNHGSRFVGPHQVGGVLRHGGVFMPFDSIALQSSAAIPFSEVLFGAIRYSFPITASGLSVDMTASYSDSEPGLTLSDLEAESDSFSADFNLSYPLIRSRKTSFDIRGGLSVRNSATEFLDQELIDDKVRSLYLASEVQIIDDWQGSNFISGSLHKGVNIFGATETGSDKLSRTQGRSDFIKLEINASRQQILPSDLALSANAKAQYAPHPLLSSEEFGYGGAAYGRAYDPSNITGDQGVAAAMELRYTGIDVVDHLNLKLVPFVFYDIGKIWNEDTGSDPESAASAGLGAHYNFNNRISGSVQAAWPLTRSVSTPVMGGEDGPRILFSLSSTF